MTSGEAIRAFVAAHPTWKGMTGSLSTRDRDGWTYIVFQGSEIGRVKVEGRKILAESFWSVS